MANENPLKVIGAFEIDRLGTLLAKIADLTKEADSIKADLKDSGFTEIEGNLFRATVSTSDKVTIDSAKARLFLGDKVSLVEKHSTVVTVRVVSR